MGICLIYTAFGIYGQPAHDNEFILQTQNQLHVKTKQVEQQVLILAGLPVLSHDFSNEFQTAGGQAIQKSV